MNEVPVEEEKKPGFGDILVATQELNNYGYRLLRHYSQTEEDDNLFDLNSIKNTKYQSYAWGFKGVSQLEARRRMEQIDEDERNIQIMQNAPWYKELLAGLTLPFTDPTVLGAGAAGSLASVALRAGIMATPFAVPAGAVGAAGLIAGGLAFGAAHWAIGNYTKKVTSDVEPEQSWQQLLIDSTVGIAAEYGLGKVFSRFSKKKPTLKSYNQPTMEGEGVTTSLVEEAATDAKYIAKRLQGQEPTLAELKRQYEEAGLSFYWENPNVMHSLLNRFSHGVLGRASYHNKVIARGGAEAQRALAEMKVLDRNNALNKAGHASQIALEAKIARSVSEKVGLFEELFVDGFENTNIKTRNEFSRELYRAYLNEGVHEDRAVSDTAKKMLDQLGHPTDKTLFDLGVTFTEKPSGENAYLPIIYDVSKVVDKQGKVDDKFYGFMRNYLETEQIKRGQNLEIIRGEFQGREDAFVDALTKWEMQRGSGTELTSILEGRRAQLASITEERRQEKGLLYEARLKLREKRASLTEARREWEEAKQSLSSGADADQNVASLKNKMEERRNDYIDARRSLNERRAQLLVSREKTELRETDHAKLPSQEYSAARKEFIALRKQYREQSKNLSKASDAGHDISQMKEDLDGMRGRLLEQRQVLSEARIRLGQERDRYVASLLEELAEDIPDQAALVARIDRQLSGYRSNVRNLQRQLQDNYSILRRFRGQVAEAEFMEFAGANKKQISNVQNEIKRLKNELRSLRGTAKISSRELKAIKKDFAQTGRKYSDDMAYVEMTDIDSVVGRITSNIVNGDVEMGSFTVPVSTKSIYRRERKIRVPQLSLLDFTNNDFYSVFKHYLNKSATDIEIAKIYGPGLKFRGSPAHKRMIAERDKMIKSNAKYTPWIMVQYEKNIRDLENILLRLGGRVPGQKKRSTENWLEFAARVQRGITSSAVLGMNWIQSVNELATLAMAGGMQAALKTISPSSWGYGKLARDELRSMRLGLHMSKVKVAKRTLRDVLFDYKQQPVRETVADLAQLGSRAVSYATFNRTLEFLRTRALLGTVKSNLGFIADKAARGRVRKKDLMFARALGLSDSETKRVGELIRKYGRPSRGYYGVDKWNDPELVNKVMDALNVCIIKRNTGPSKVNLPFIYEHPLWKSVLQYTSWIPVFTNKVMIPGIMDHHRELAITAIGYTAVNFATKKLKYQLQGTDISDEDILYEACVDNSFLGWGRELFNRAENVATGLYTNNYSMVGRGALGTAGGAIQDTARMGYAIFSGRVFPGHKMTNAEFNAFWNLTPARSAPGLVKIYKRRKKGKRKVGTQYG